MVSAVKLGMCIPAFSSKCTNAGHNFGSMRDAWISCGLFNGPVELPEPAIMVVSAKATRFRGELVHVSCSGIRVAVF